MSKTAIGRKKFAGLVVAGVATLGLVACSTTKKVAEDSIPNTVAPTPLIDPASVNADELGEVPVLMYHRIVPTPKSDLDVTPEVFRAELETFAQRKFVTITAAEFASGAIDIPAGTHPIVLAFDDGWRSHLSLLDNGQPDPNSAAAIILDVAKKYPTFRGTATFFVNREPFQDPTGNALRWAVAHGFEIGNHTLTHPKLSRLKNFQSQREIVRLERAVAKIDPSVKIHTIALPYGLSPKTESYARIGSWNKTTYRYDGVFLAGAGPSRSPYDERFNPLRIPRIVSDAQHTSAASSPSRETAAGASLETSTNETAASETSGGESSAGETSTGETAASESTVPGESVTTDTGESVLDAKFSSTAWFAQFAEKPSVLYTSDGDPNRISFPENRSSRLAAQWQSKANPYAVPKA